MKAVFSIWLLAFAAAGVLAQAPAQAAGAKTTELGFSYNVPSGWELLDLPSMAETRSQAADKAGSEEEKKGLACLEPVLTARDRKSGSVLSVEALPFACFGKEMTNEDLPGFASGAPEVLKQSFDIGDPVFGTYALGSHNMWIERAHASLKDHPELPFTVEIACGLLKKAAVCWMAVAGNDAALQAFERASVILDGETAIALVPPTAFDKKPT